MRHIFGLPLQQDIEGHENPQHIGHVRVHEVMQESGPQQQVAASRKNPLPWPSEILAGEMDLTIPDNCSERRRLITGRRTLNGNPDRTTSISSGRIYASTICVSSAGTVSNIVLPGGSTPPIVATLRPVTTPDCAAKEIRVLLGQFLAAWNFSLRRPRRGLSITASTPWRCSGLL